MEYYVSHRMVERIIELCSQLIGWDIDKGRAMKAAGNVLHKPPKKYCWSPILRNRAFIRIYWKLRLREIQEGKNYHEVFIRWQSQLRTYDSTSRFPNLNEILSLEGVRAQYNKALAALTNAKLNQRRCGSNVTRI